MKYVPKMLVMLWAAALLASAPLASGQQPKDKPKKGSGPQKSTETKDPPRVAVIANVQVNISTSIQVGGAPGRPQPMPERKAERSKEASATDLLPALGKASQGGPGVVVLANVKI